MLIYGQLLTCLSKKKIEHNISEMERNWNIKNKLDLIILLHFIEIIKD